MSRWAAHAASPSDRIEMLKGILEKLQSTDELDGHPWTRSPMVAEAIAAEPQLGKLGQGRQLLFALASLFAETMPNVPPRRGLRLDTNWGAFGLLAARYFAPLKYGASMPATLRDAWGQIDQAILLFVYGHSNGSLSAEDVARYRLVGGEPNIAPDSTLSDWHRKGLERLAQRIQEREAHRQTQAMESADPRGRQTSRSTRRSPLRPLIWGTISLLLVLLLALGAAKAYRIFQLAQNVRADGQALASAVPSSFEVEPIVKAAGLLPGLDRDLTALKAEAGPFLWLGPAFGWVPTYGGDISQAGSLLDLAQHLTRSAEMVDGALAPALVDVGAGQTQSRLGDILTHLSAAQPGLLKAKSEFGQALSAREQINPGKLSPGLRDLITRRLDPGMALMQDGLSIGIALPTVVGAGADGPKTYLLIAQNEDELRPTGGFITAVGKLVLDQGHVVDLSFENSGDLDNWSMPYPMAPWQLQQYMNSSVLILRDANWFPDFPTAVLYIKQLYAYSRQNSVDGVIAFDQQMLIMMLRALGPLQVEGAAEPVTAANVVQFMRESKTPPSGQPVPVGWTYKAFIGKLAEAVMNKLTSEDTMEWRSISRVGLEALQQRHLLIQLDQADVASVLTRHDWNGALASDAGDFLTVIDSNVGFNKTNAVVDTKLSYAVDLSNPAAPASELVVTHTNRAADVPCVQWDTGVITGEESYPIDRCYWDYMRVYVPQGTRLTGALPQTIPDAWLLPDRHVLPTVDPLDENLPGLASFGTMLVVPGQGTVETRMHFALPAGQVVRRNPDGTCTYSISVRKQPGTVAVPLSILIHLPEGATIGSQPQGWTLNGQDLSIQTNLQVDFHTELTFQP